MPLYGQSFTLADKKNNGLIAKAPRGGEAGEYTRASGFLAYYKVVIFNFRSNVHIIIGFFTLIDM